MRFNRCIPHFIVIPINLRILLKNFSFRMKVDILVDHLSQILSLFYLTMTRRSICTFIYIRSACTTWMNKRNDSVTGRIAIYELSWRYFEKNKKKIFRTTINRNDL